MTEMDITYIFIRYISVTIRRQANTFFNKHNRIIYYENEDLVENNIVEKVRSGNDWSSTSSFYGNIEEKVTFQEIFFEELNSLNNMEKHILFEKFWNCRSDMDIGKDYSVSSQTISKRKRKILNKLKSIFYT
jgi:DNA-directed RNA polymerase specialized sigma subunit